MKLKRNLSALDQAGFSLVEIMVGMAIGLLATLVIMQMITSFEAQKRVTTGAADAQTNGGIAMFNIERELQLAGYPLTPANNSPLRCTTLNINGVADTSTSKILSPVIITDGAGNTSDTITIRFGNTDAGGVPTLIKGVAIGQDVPVASSFGCSPSETTLITDVSATTCDISAVSAVIAGNPLATPPAPAFVRLLNTNGVAPFSYLSCLGAWNEITYQVIGGNLNKRTSTPYGNPPVNNGFNPVVAGIVDIQAQYGIAAIAASQSTQSNQVIQWVDATGIWASDVLTVANRNRIKAIRISMVARNNKKEPEPVTSNPLTAWVGSASSPAPTIDLSADPDWKKYHYRVYETMIPLRNVMWSKGLL